ncbi:transglutaminase-like cysteine peptidase [Rhizobium sp. Root1220]|uniref:transglutaminase-like cysteine peptidase n=1 Tax=Rhizobium sp. Root1220 TaxID=1736432 RepID=UPI0006F1DEF0|nr:transglutaminase-like cysteine peptidase [Rhizobium sp. Root1220]KQV68052.1 hypothetical protein ASC90_10335 [Rhizobium sp. Root1220]
MKRSIKIKKIAALTLFPLISIFGCGNTEASALSTAQLVGGIYSTTFAADSARVLVQGGGISRFVDLVSHAARDIVQAAGSLDHAALSTKQQLEPAGWVRESTGSIIPAPRPATARSPGKAAFGTVAIPFKRLAALKKIAPSLAEMADGTAIACGVGKCSEAATAINASFHKTAQASIRDKLNAVNVTVNHAIRYRRDIDTYQVADYWATPAETLLRQQGDCEDFAILKMATLHAEGVAMKDMAIVILFDQKRHFYHAVLSVQVDDRRFILDNMRDQVLTDTALPDYLPLYSIADGKGYLHGIRVGGSQLAAAVPIEKVAPGEGMAF